MDKSESARSNSPNDAKNVPRNRNNSEFSGFRAIRSERACFSDKAAAGSTCFSIVGRNDSKYSWILLFEFCCDNLNASLGIPAKNL